jgi:hypothetical protein
MKVMGRYFMNSPIMPGQKSSGTNTITVAVVAAMIGMVTSPTARRVAFMAGSPLVMWRWMFSTITIPSSTKRPSARIRAKSTIMFSVTPNALSSVKEMNMDMGIAKPTNSALRRPRKSMSTPTTRITPSTMWFISSSTLTRV